MKIAVVICEYNPFQKGHAYLLAQSARLTGCDKIVCIMSGNFTQRGELAITDKYTRAMWALRGGADAVVELPPQYVLSSAEFFALGGIKIASSIAADIVLCFGSECADIDKLDAIARFEESEEFKRNLNLNLSQGAGYAKSYASAMRDISDDFAQIISSPNNILAVEYLKAIKNTGSKITPLTIKREGGGYLNKEYDEKYSSASAVRNMLSCGDWENVKKSVPNYVYDDLKSIDYSAVSDSQAILFSLLKYIARSRDLSNIHGIKEGVENRITAALDQSDNYCEFIQKVSTKRYTDSYISRTLINILLDNDYSCDRLKNAKPEYVNVLAIKEQSKDILSLFDCRVNVKSSTLPSDSLIVSADRLYSSVRGNISSIMKVIGK